MGKHEKPVSGTSRKSEARLPRAERTPSVREEELLFDIPETAERVTAHAAETLPDSKAEPLPENEAAPAETETAENAAAEAEAPAEKE